MKKIEREVFVSKRERKLYNSVIAILKSSDTPLSIDTLSFLLNIPSFKACRILRKLEKWNIAKPATCTKTTFWKLAE